MLDQLPALDFRRNVVQRHAREELLPFLGVVAVAGGKLGDKPHGIHQPNFSCQDPDRIMRHFCQRLCFCYHASISSIATTGETTLTFKLESTFARFNNLSSQVQK